MIDHQYYYIDKSEWILTALYDKVSLFTRPRRFGKTLNMSMLYYFLSNIEKQNAYLFQNLKINQHEKMKRYQNQYPVISLSLKNMKYDQFSMQIEYLLHFVLTHIKTISRNLSP